MSLRLTLSLICRQTAEALSSMRIETRVAMAGTSSGLVAKVWCERFIP
jgi:hypothetical protein